MQGKIVKGISGFYYVHVAESGIYECKAKGAFRNQKIKPLVGDDVRIAVIDENLKKGNIESILPRKNELIRPAVANIDLALIIFAAAKPQPNFNLLDRFLVMMGYQNVPVTICFNKKDLVEEKEQARLSKIYENCGYQVLFVSAKEGEGIDELQAVLKGKTTAVAGPSGVGKSSLINTLQPNVKMETGTISRKIERGKHTTRHSEIIPIEGNTYIMDTPGFSTLLIPGFEKEDLQQFYPEFAEYEPYCRFQGCSHISEPDCGVKDALEEGKISTIRYENYKLLYDELKNVKKY
ncbi:MAG: ribosome small subunit-dependent GTPase A [Roseburia sp.]|uniref:ribosome small subunit-dependent GTPase A n=1 Tax=Roseburia sp. 831b TaxID=1261635 RepID=UPI00095345A3|nr:ribosome small subunit-dependent GTPase A [Roseburia sp. 831b]MCI5918703.1 ribosome small subunit-dependent GTPase A [Roseburia sp.]MDD6215492.1 ribosome small subunit-dependent GTPase A [Roseburia sp.]MDY5884477.1 ribosome small subunit-dependent GTPase A [Roseburia sp.]WVK73458.1 ribosome small subunit-dependent GTPase A [Roseburia sp. 831b]